MRRFERRQIPADRSRMAGQFRRNCVYQLSQRETLPCPTQPLEQMPLTFRGYFDPAGRRVNAASILPSMLQDFGDVERVLSAIGPRNMLIAAGLGQTTGRLPTLEHTEGFFSENPRLLTDWLK